MRFSIRSYTRASGKKSLNEDYKLADKHGIGVIADGVGGSPAGMQAAFEACNWTMTLLRQLKKDAQKTQMSSDDIRMSIEKVFHFTNDIILSVPERVKNFEGWKTTLDACMIYDGTAYIGHAGDSRVYHHDGDLKQVTEDHSGILYDLSNLEDRFKQVASMLLPLDNCMGKEGLYVNTYELPMGPGDMIFMCTDGVNKKVKDETLIRILSKEFADVKSSLVKRIKGQSDYIQDYMSYRNKTEEDAHYELTDDSTFIMIRRDE